MSRKFTELEKRTIKLAHSCPKGSAMRRELLAALKDAGVFTEKEWESYVEEHPDADPRFHTIITKKDQEKAQQDKAEKEKAEDGEEGEDGSPGYDAEQLAEESKKSFDEALEKSKGLGGKVKDFLSEEGSFTEFLEAFAAVITATLFPDKGGDEFLSDIQSRMGVKKDARNEVKIAMEELKGVELAAMFNPKIAKQLKEIVGVDTMTEEEEKRYEDLRKYFTEGEGAGDLDGMPEELKNDLYAIMSKLDRKRVAFLTMFVDEEKGELDLEAFRKHMRRFDGAGGPVEVEK